MSGTITRIGATGAGALLALGILAAAPAGASESHRTDNGGHTASCFTATGHTQGRSHSDPDGMSNGGADKPGCDGGFDADKDGNNGCGNDADREDDNNGNCGAKRHHEGVAGDTGSSTTTTSTTTTTTSKPVSVEPADDVDDDIDACLVDPKESDHPCPTVTVAKAAVARLSAAGTTAAGTSVAGTGVEAAATPAGATAAGTTSGTGAAVDASTTATAPDTQVLGQTLSRPSALARTGAGVGSMAFVGFLLCGSGRLAVLARRLLRIG